MEEKDGCEWKQRRIGKDTFEEVLWIEDLLLQRPMNVIDNTTIKDNQTNHLKNLTRGSRLSLALSLAAHTTALFNLVR